MPKTLADVVAEVEQRKEKLASYCAELFAHDKTITLEVGCGHGHFLAAYAQAHSNEFCVGIDLVTKRIEKGILKKTKQKIERLQFIKADLNEFLDAMPSDVSLNKIFMLFPDPWPKKRHHKNRMLQRSFLDKIAQNSCSTAKFYLRTDHAGLFDWSMEHILQHPQWEVDVNACWPFEKDSFFQNLMDDWQSLIAKRKLD